MAKDEDDCRTRAELLNTGSRGSITLPLVRAKIAEEEAETFRSQ